MKKILLNILTHGDELIGLEVVKRIKDRYPHIIGNGLDIQIANEIAYKMGERYKDKDLNRSFPGNPHGLCEEKRAYELRPIIASYDLVIDIHSTISDSEDVVIITKMNSVTLDIIRVLAPRRVLFINMAPDTSLISCAKIGVAFEMGKDGDEVAIDKSVEGIEILLDHFGLIPKRKSFGHITKYFEVFAPVKKPIDSVLMSNVKNFSMIKKGEAFAKNKTGDPIVADFDFVPVIFSNKGYETIFGFAARLLVV